MDREQAKQQASEIIDSIADNLNVLKAKSAKASGQLKEKYADQIADLEVKKAELMKKYDDFQSSSSDQFDHMKRVFMDASSSFKEGFDKLSDIFERPEEGEE